MMMMMIIIIIINTCNAHFYMMIKCASSIQR